MNRIFCVDDDKSYLGLLQASLCDSYEVDIANNGFEGLKCLEKDNEYAVIISDMNMPGMDGVSFLSEAAKLCPDSSKIMLTASQDRMTAVRAVNDGRISSFLSKPCPLDDLNSAVASGVRAFRQLRTERELRDRIDRRNRQLEDAIELKNRVLRIARMRIKEKAFVVANTSQYLLQMADVKVPLESVRHKLAYLGDIGEQLDDVVDDFIWNEDHKLLFTEPTYSKVCVGERLSAICRAYRASAEDKKAFISFWDDTRSELYTCDADRMCVIFESMLKNAVQFSPSAEVVQVRLQCIGDVLRVEVEDAGPGLNVGEREQLGLLFDDVATAPTPGEANTGMGLWFASKMIDSLKGRIGFLELEAVHSTVFWFEVPWMNADA